MDTGAVYIDLIRQLGQLRPAVYVFGGFAEDALLEGRILRSHSDIDVLVRRSELEHRMRQFTELGFEHFDLFYQLEAGRPQVLNGERVGAHLEVCIFEEDGPELYFLVDAPDGRRYRIYVEPDAFKQPPTLIEGVELQTVSPLMLYQVRAALQQIGAFGELRPHDAERQRRIREELLAHLPDEALLPDTRIDNQR